MYEQVTIGDWELALRLLLSASLCGVIGFEREIRGQVAGLRTHILVGLGATLFTLVSAYGFQDLVPFVPTEPGQTPPPRPDPARVAAQIVTGIGFLGAGAILRQGFSVRGLTTAAALWMVAAIGMAVGVGYYFGAIAATGVVIGTLVALRWFERTALPRVRGGRTVFDLSLGSGVTVAEVLATVEGMGVEVERVTLEDGTYRLALRLPEELGPHDVASRLKAHEEVSAVRVSGG